MDIDTSVHTSQKDIFMYLLIKVSSTVSKLTETQDILDGVLFEISSNLKVDACWIQIYNPVEKILVLSASHGLSEEMVEEINITQMGQTFTGHVAQTREPIIRPDITLESEYPWKSAVQSGFCSVIALPILYSGQMLGVIGLASFKANQFNQDHINLLSIVGTIIADACNITPIRQQAIQQMKHQEDIIQSQQYLNTLGHELKTPLTAIMASVSLLSEELERRNETILLKIASNIERSASSLNNRINDLLNFSKAKSTMYGLEKKAFDFSSFVKEVLEQFSSLLKKKKQTLDIDIPDSLTINGDRQRLEQILFNLLSNAIKFSPEGGRITLRAKVEKNSLLVEVQDTGKGIPPEEKHKLFLPYSRLSADRHTVPGLGLGLSITKQLVELHGGTIWVDSEEGKGSTFAFSIPINDEQFEQNGV
jgi:signal transduction histidine kinase